MGIVLIRKSAIIAIKVVLETNPIAQIYAATWVIAIALFVHIKASPYAFSVLTGTEMLSLMAAQVYYVPELGGSDEEVVNTEYHAVLTIVLVVLLVGTTFYMASLAVRQKLSKMRDKLPRIVWCLCRLSALEAQSRAQDGKTLHGLVEAVNLVEEREAQVADMSYSEYETYVAGGGTSGLESTSGLSDESGVEMVDGGDMSSSTLYSE